VAIAFYLPGNFPVYASSILFGMGAMLGLSWIAWQAPPERRLREVDAGLLALLGGLVGGRLAFVAADWAYFQSHWGEIALIHLGGMSWAGALVGGLVATVLLELLSHQPLGATLSELWPLWATVTVSAWLGCWLDGCAYGPPAAAWWGVLARDEWGAYALRWPTQLLGALLALVLFGLLNWVRSRGLDPWLLAGLGVIGLSLEMLALSFLRADPSLQWRGLRLDTWAALALTIGAFLAFLVSYLYRLINKQGIRDRG
jgi:phosphatidylglycerol---prolipoprotein diacylglyceryl transferase